MQHDAVVTPRNLFQPLGEPFDFTPRHPVLALKIAFCKDQHRPLKSPDRDTLADKIRRFLYPRIRFVEDVVLAEKAARVYRYGGEWRSCLLAQDVRGKLCLRDAEFPLDLHPLLPIHPGAARRNHAGLKCPLRELRRSVHQSYKGWNIAIILIKRDNQFRTCHDVNPSRSVATRPSPIGSWNRHKQ